ncbi:MAG: acetate--CoA ligase family protein [Desulfobacteraceae bacterium]|nr:acetate--CoA ligase family protein [Desulfobacteraceae bacterium]
MLKTEIKTVLEAARTRGWVSEPDAKRLLASAGLAVPRFVAVTDPGQIELAAADLGFPLAAKVVSTRIVHKSDVGGVLTGIESTRELTAIFKTFSHLDGFEAMLIEQMVSGLELIIGAKIDDQFGPVILLGMGGTGVEIYQDVSLRMAPLGPEDVGAMIKGLKAGRLLSGYRGRQAVNRDELTRTLVCFSKFVMAAADMIESIDLNPVMCSAQKCVVADARIMLPPVDGPTAA